MASYTMRADGTAANKAAAVDGDPAVVSECMSLATAVGETYSAGDELLLADTGGAFRGKLQPPSSGSIGSPITWKEYPGDSPVVMGSSLLTSWTQSQPTIFSDNFNDNDISDWDTVGAGVAAANQRVEITNAGAGNYRLLEALGASYTECTVSWEFTIKSGHTGWANNENYRGAGLRNSSTVKYLLMGVQDDSGTKRVYYYYSTDTGTTSGEVAAGTTLLDDTAYTFKIYFKQASGAGQNDGIVRMWVDDTLEYENTSVDNDTISFNQAHAGCEYADDIADLVTYVDDYTILGAAGNIWYNEDLSADPTIVWLDDTAYAEAASAAAVDATNRWFWDSGTPRLYVYGTSDPSTFYSSTGVEAPSVTDACLIWNDDYNTFENITFKYGTAAAVRIGGASNNNIFDGCTISGASGAAASAALMIQGNGTDDNTITGCTISALSKALHCDGLRVMDDSGVPDGTTISKCTINGASHSALKYHGTNGTIEQNLIQSSAGFGRCFEILGDVGEGGNVFQHNVSIGDRSDGDFSAGGNSVIGDGNKCLYNIIYDSVSSGKPALILFVGGDAGEDACRNNLYYGNVIYGSVDAGVRVSGTLTASDTGNIFKNNIFVGNDTTDNYQVQFDNIAEINNACCEFKNNIIWHTSTSNTVYDGGSARTVAYMESNYSSEWADNVVDNPDFTDAGADDYTLASNSPCIDAGVDLGASYDDALDPSSTCPSAVVTIDQDVCGPGWEIGAYARIAAIVADVASASVADNLTMAFSAGTIIIPDAVSASVADNLTMAFSAGTIIIPDAASASVADNLTMAFSAGSIIIPDAVSASVVDNLTMTFTGASTGDDDGINGPRIMTVLLLRG